MSLFSIFSIIIGLKYNIYSISKRAHIEFILYFNCFEPSNLNVHFFIFLNLVSCVCYLPLDINFNLVILKYNSGFNDILEVVKNINSYLGVII